MKSPIGIFAATRWELHAVLRAVTPYEPRSVGGRRYWRGSCHDRPCLVFKTGIGPQHAASLCRAVVQALRPSVIVSTGFACALNEALVGDVLIGTEVVGGFSPIPQQPLACAEACTRLAVQAVAQAGLPSWSGRFASVPRVLCEAREKQAVADASGAIGVDMESAALAMVAREAGISFAIIRTVSDRKNEELPLDFNLFLRPTGWMAGGLACLSHPSSISGLSRLRRQSRIAAERLTAFYASYVPLLSADRTIA